MSVSPIGVVIADDHAVTRRGVAAMLAAAGDLEILAEAASGEEAIQRCAELKPQVVFLDFRMPGSDGLATIQGIKSVSPATSVIVLTVEDDEQTVVEAIRAGASGYLSKSSSADDLVRAIRAIDAEGVYMSPEIASKVIWFASNDPPARHARAADMTAREHQVLGQLRLGRTSRAIASALGISQRTVESHIASVYRRLGVSNRVDAVLEALRLGLVDPPA